MIEALEHSLPMEHPLRSLFVGQAPTDRGPQPMMNVLLHHGVRSCLEYTRSGDIRKARALSNPNLSPHISFVDMGGHGYAVVRAASDSLEAEFVCIPRPLERSERDDGGPILYRTRHHARLWRKGERPQLGLQIIQGDPKFSI
jgi:alkaline phosphatase D